MKLSLWFLRDDLPSYEQFSLAALAGGGRLPDEFAARTMVKEALMMRGKHPSQAPVYGQGVVMSPQRYAELESEWVFKLSTGRATAQDLEDYATRAIGKLGQWAVTADGTPLYNTATRTLEGDHFITYKDARQRKALELTRWEFSPANKDRVLKEFGVQTQYDTLKKAQDRENMKRILIALAILGAGAYVVRHRS